MNKIVLILVIVLLAVGAAYYLFWGVKEKSPLKGETLPEPAESTIKIYDNRDYGFSFEYPKDYYLEEKIEKEPGRTHLVLILYENTEENTAVREGRSPGREGPVSVNVDVYQDLLGGPTLMEWLKETPASNFNLGDGTFSNATLGGNSAVSYRWSGLYEAETTAASNRDYIIAVTVNYIAPTDPVREVFSIVRDSVVFK